MARLFADGFDMYAVPSDLTLGRWTSSSSDSGLAFQVGAQTAFNVGQALSFPQFGNLLTAIFETGSNETTIYFSIRFRNTTGTLSTEWVQLSLCDGTNYQCTIQWRGNNTLAVYGGDVGGTLLGSHAAAYSANTWDSYQGKVVINNTTGSVEIRKNGSITPILSLTSVNTRAGSTNAYANQVILGCANVGGPVMDVDDMWLNSDNSASPTSWPGDVRCVTSMVASVVSAQFLPGPNPMSITPATGSSTLSKTANSGMMVPFTAPFSGTIGTVTANVHTGGTGNLKAAIYDGNSSIVLATSNAVVNPTAGSVAITFPTPLTVTKGTAYYLAVDANFTIVYNASPSLIGLSFTTTYASFPAAAPTTSDASVLPIVSVSLVPSNNAELVFDPTEDGDTSYVYSATVGQEDTYSLSALTVVPASILGVAPFVMWKKSDSGGRTGTVSLTANGSSDTGEIVGITPSLSYTYAQKFLPLDPTGAGWTAANINAMTIGLTVAS